MSDFPPRRRRPATLNEARALANELDTLGPRFVTAAQAAQVIRELCDRVEAPVTDAEVEAAWQASAMTDLLITTKSEMRRVLEAAAAPRSQAEEQP